MSLANETNTSLAFDTTVMSECGRRYEKVATELRTMAKKLDQCLATLIDSGWTTPAALAFKDLADTNWEENIEKYAALLDTLKRIIDDAVNQYGGLVTDHIEKTKL